MKVALFIAPKDFRDESISRAKALLQKWGIEVVISSYSTHECVGTHGASYMPDLNTGRVHPEDFDAIMLIDGAGVESYKLYEFRPLLDLVKHFAENKKIVCAMNNSVKIVARSNIINDVKVAVPKDSETQRFLTLYRAKPSPNAIEFDKNILTLSDSSRVEEFTNVLLDKLGVR